MPPEPALTDLTDFCISRHRTGRNSKDIELIQKSNSSSAKEGFCNAKYLLERLIRGGIKPYPVIGDKPGSAGLAGLSGGCHDARLTPSHVKPYVTPTRWPG